MREEAASMLFHFAEGGNEVTPRDPSTRGKARSSSYAEAYWDSWVCWVGLDRELQLRSGSRTVSRVFVHWQIDFISTC